MRSLKSLGNTPGIMCGLCKVHKDIFDNSLLFRHILLAINNPTYKLAKFLVPILKALTSNDIQYRTHLLLLRKLLNKILNF